MSYHKFTIISGYDTDEENPFSFAALGRPPVGEEMDNCSLWNEAHYKNVSLSGHWKTESAWAYAQKRGWKNVTMTHHVSDLSGKGRGERIEYSFGRDGTAICVADESVDDSEDVHAIYDEADGRL